MLALAANSSKLAGRRRCCMTHSMSAEFSGRKSGAALVAVVAGAGLEATGVGWADWDSTAGCDALVSGIGVLVAGLCAGLLQPANSAVAQTTHKICPHLDSWLAG